MSLAKAWQFRHDRGVALSQPMPSPKPSSELRKYITRNSEYYVRGNVCLEVRERDSSNARHQHGATKQRIVACVRWKREGGHDVLIGTTPEIGDSLLLGDAPPHQVLTSAVRRIEGTSDAPADPGEARPQTPAGLRRLPA